MADFDRRPTEFELYGNQPRVHAIAFNVRLEITEARRHRKDAMRRRVHLNDHHRVSGRELYGDYYLSPGARECPMSTSIPPCDCLNVCFDDERVRAGRVTPCEFGARQLAENRQTEELHWVNPTPTTMPDSDSTVLCELEGDSERVWPGYWDGTYWCSIEGSVFAGTVTGWAEWPNGREGRGHAHQA